ncbi:MAG TPA: type II toxin-antitoxin system prevent-host-death family antitoxin [Thermomicrobiales bacterium]|nr:type II toxin-antitoxin system prevent-host-death family antitoxin [Thermomicrobiales bacterium]
MTSIPIESLKFTETRSRLSSVVDSVFQRKTRIRVYKGNTPVAAIVSIADLERLEMLDRERLGNQEGVTSMVEDGADLSQDDVDTRIYEIVARVRQELWAERVAAE